MTLNKENRTLAEEFAPLVKAIALRLAMRLPSHIDVDDLISVGITGLIESLERYDPSKGVKMETFLTFRVRGAMLDELRRLDWMPRSVRQKARQLEDEFAECEEKLGRAPSDEEMAEHLGIELEDYYKLLHDASGSAILSLEEMGFRNGVDKRNILETLADPDSEDPAAMLGLKEKKAALAGAIDELPDKEKLVLSFYYYEDLNLKEIGAVLGVSESRVCQLHTQAIVKLKGKLRARGL